tara:strand:+ start:478 stop:696 length:219 start_codon:yes stop_codon:yes gene_type:complete
MNTFLNMLLGFCWVIFGFTALIFGIDLFNYAPRLDVIYFFGFTILFLATFSGWILTINFNYSKKTRRARRAI